MTEPYPNEALTAVCEMLQEDFELTAEQIRSLASDILVECSVTYAAACEAAMEELEAALMETGGPDDTAYRNAMKQAGRGHLLRK